MRGYRENLKVDDALSLLAIPEVSRVAPVVRGSVQARYLNKNTRTTLVGTSPSYLGIRDFNVTRGRAIADADADAMARVAMIGPATAKNLFGDDFAWGLGQRSR